MTGRCSAWPCLLPSVEARSTSSGCRSGNVGVELGFLGRESGSAAVFVELQNAVTNASRPTSSDRSGITRSSVHHLGNGPRPAAPDIRPAHRVLYGASARSGPRRDRTLRQPRPHHDRPAASTRKHPTGTRSPTAAHPSTSPCTPNPPQTTPTTCEFGMKPPIGSGGAGYGAGAGR
jgi:hypothetical protein